jgi:hypothetical protein
MQLSVRIARLKEALDHVFGATLPELVNAIWTYAWGGRYLIVLAQDSGLPLVYDIDANLWFPLLHFPTLPGLVGMVVQRNELHALSSNDGHVVLHKLSTNAANWLQQLVCFTPSSTDPERKPGPAILDEKQPAVVWNLETTIYTRVIVNRYYNGVRKTGEYYNGRRYDHTWDKTTIMVLDRTIIIAGNGTIFALIDLPNTELKRLPCYLDDYALTAHKPMMAVCHRRRSVYHICTAFPNWSLRRLHLDHNRWQMITDHAPEIVGATVSIVDDRYLFVLGGLGPTRIDNGQTTKASWTPSSACYSIDLDICDTLPIPIQFPSNVWTTLKPMPSTAHSHIVTSAPPTLVASLS